MNEIFLQNGNKIWLSIISVRKFRIKTNHANTEVIRDSKGDFLELKFSELLSFKKGDRIEIRDINTGNYITFILNNISSISSTEFEGIEQTTNKTCIFLLPLLGYNHIYFDYNYSLYNCYVSEDYKYLYLKYKWTGTQKYMDLEEKLQSHSKYMEFRDINKEFIVFKFKIDDAYRQVVDCVIRGKYSSIPENIKLNILEFHGSERNSRLGHVLFKDERYRKQLELKLGTIIPNNLDLMSKSTKEEEIWNYQNISQKIGIES